MQRTLLLVALAGSLALACAQAPDSADYQATMLMLPEGEPDAGREAFVSLGCATCHSVAWADDLPAPLSATPGPELGLDVLQAGPGRIATSIVAPSHRVADKYRAMTEGEVSPMRDNNSVMTIRQLSDIVAFLQRQGLETRSRTGVSPGS